MTDTKKHLLEQVVADCRSHFDRTIANAEQALENFRTEHYQNIAKSAARIAALESNLEMYDGLEQTRMAAQTRREIAAAVEDHKQVVIGANNRLQHACENYVRAFSSAAMAMECSFNAAMAAAAK
jgi:hypothetical protein